MTSPFLNNKLLEVQPYVGMETTEALTGRRENNLLTWILIRYTKLTRAYLLRAETTSQWISCIQKLTVKHILIEGKKYKNSPNKFYNTLNLKRVFKTMEPTQIIEFKLFDDNKKKKINNSRKNSSLFETKDFTKWSKDVEMSLIKLNKLSTNRSSNFPNSAKVSTFWWLFRKRIKKKK